MPKIINFVRTGENTFDILVADNNKEQSYSVTRNYVFLKDSGESMPLINCEDRTFFEIYLEIRQDLWQMIEEAEFRQTLQISELQTA